MIPQTVQMPLWDFLFVQDTGTAGVLVLFWKRLHG